MDEVKIEWNPDIQHKIDVIMQVLEAHEAEMQFLRTELANHIAKEILNAKME